MITCMVSVRPRGSMEHEVIVAEVEIVNDESGNELFGNYTYAIQTYNSLAPAQDVIITGRIAGVSRTRSALHVLAEVLDKEGLQL